MRPRWVRAAAWVLGLVGIAVVLRLAAVGDLTAPPISSPGRLGEWIDGRTPAAAAVALVRFGAELAAWYLVGLSALHAIAELLGARAGHRVLGVLAVPGASRLVRAGLGLGLVAASSVGAADRSPPPPAPSMLVPQPATDERAGTASMRPTLEDPHAASPAGGTAWMRPTTTVSEARPTALSPGTWTVTEGDSLWSIAEEVLGSHLGRAATDIEIDPYWRRLVEANRYRLVDPDDADLIVPGQVFELPAPR